MPAGPKFALVRWLNGQHAGDMTHNVQTSWIRNFDPASDFRSEESFVVEWRQPPMPRSGYPLYDAVVLDVSGDVDFCKARMQDIERQGTNSAMSFSSASTPRSRTSLSTVDMNSAEFRRAVAAAVGATSSPNFRESPMEENLVRVGQALKISRSTHLMAKASRTGSSRTMLLVRAAFSKRRLRKSLYAGQKRRKNGQEIQKPSLKKCREMQDIQDFVLSRFPYMSQASFGAAVNNCLGLNVDKKKERTLVELSESEDSGSESGSGD